MTSASFHQCCSLNSGFACRVSAPFLLMPAVAVVRPGRKQTLRIVYNGGALPQDRETVYYLNLVELPPKSSGARAAPEMKVAVRTRIKIFMQIGRAHV